MPSVPGSCRCARHTSVLRQEPTTLFLPTLPLSNGPKVLVARDASRMRVRRRTTPLVRTGAKKIPVLNGPSSPVGGSIVAPQHKSSSETDEAHQKQATTGLSLSCDVRNGAEMHVGCKVKLRQAGVRHGRKWSYPSHLPTPYRTDTVPRTVENSKR